MTMYGHLERTQYANIDVNVRCIDVRGRRHRRGWRDATVEQRHHLASKPLLRIAMAIRRRIEAARQALMLPCRRA
jgi:hypothetical protein